MIYPRDRPTKTAVHVGLKGKVCILAGMVMVYQGGKDGCGLVQGGRPANPGTLPSKYAPVRTGKQGPT